MDVNKHNINTLSEYIDILSKYPSNKFFYRGESSYYDDRISSALRGYLKDHDFDDKELLNEFYHEVSYKLSSSERRCFIAFAQHHGIPTPLLDVTSAPLVALFFACYENKKSLSANGYIYIYNKYAVNISEILEKYPNRNIMELLISDDISFLKALIECFNVYYRLDEDSLREYLIKAFMVFINIFSAYSQIDKAEDEMIDIINSKNNYQINTLLHEMLIEFPFTSSYREIIEGYYLNNYESYSWSYVFILKGILMFYYDDKSIETWIDFIPNFIYKPALDFERGRSQSGFFLYQLNVKYVENTFPMKVILRQKLYHDAILLINNPDKVLKELDNIGINEKSIYKDFDSIARYILESKKRI